MNKVLRLPSNGRLLISADMHGNHEDFRRLSAYFTSLRQKEPETHWVILGDAVHGPSLEASMKNQELYGYQDESWVIVEGIIALQERHPGRVHFLIGNHDYGHIGGYHTSKFYDDEVEHLEASLSTEQLQRLQEFLRGAMIAAVAPCGAFLAHGAPEDCIENLRDLERIMLPAQDHESRTILRSLITSYGQPRETAERFLRAASNPGLEVRFMIHGHDKDEAGFFFEGENQLCPVLFGAPDENKRVVLLDLSIQYGSVMALRDGVEILRLYSLDP
jgi:Calcineurin-like phosphoesterase